jgi:hypothetical protein
MINALIDIGTQFASLCYEENRQELHKTKVEWTSEQFSAKISQFSGGQEIRSLVRAEMIKLLENQGLFYSRGRKLILNLVPGNRAQIKSYFDKLSNFCKDINMTDEKQKNLDDL